MIFAIRVEDTKGKTFLVEADDLDTAIDKVVCNHNIDLENEESEREIFSSPYASEGGIATNEELEDCEVLSDNELEKD